MQTTPTTLDRLERIVDAAGVAATVEARLPVGVRPRQLAVRTLLIGMLLAATDARPAHLTRIHRALLALPEPDRRRLGVLVDWPSGPHPLSYRQLEYTFARVARALAKQAPDGAPCDTLSDTLDALLEASVQVLGAPASSSYAVDWTDHETWSRPPPKPPAAPADHEPAGEAEPPARCADPEASWGHRRAKRPGQRDEAFFGYYLQVVTAVNDETGPEVPELVRRIQLTACHIDPPGALVAVIERMARSGVAISDVLADSGYAYRVPETWALPIRRLGIQLIQDLHPNDRGPHATHMGATAANGNLYCPATPTALLTLGPLAPAASTQQTATHDDQTAELARYKLAPITAYDHDGYRRVACPATTAKLRCPHRPQSMTLPHDRPEVLCAPDQPPVSCTQKTITVPASVNDRGRDRRCRRPPAQIPA